MNAATGGVEIEAQGQSQQAWSMHHCFVVFQTHILTLHTCDMNAATGGEKSEAQGQGQRSQHGACAALWRVLRQDPRSHRQALCFLA